MKEAIIALAVEIKQGVPTLIETLSDGREITILEASLNMGERDPLRKVYEFRERQHAEDDEFSEYVEDLLCKPFLKNEVQNHGVRWLKSKLRIEKFQKDEDDAAQIIANYAFEIFRKKSELKDFFLAGPKSQVRIRVFVLETARSLSA